MSLKDKTMKIVKMEKCSTGWIHFLTQEDLNKRNSAEQKELNRKLKILWDRNRTKEKDDHDKS
jgi:hypothetical protein